MCQVVRSAREHVGHKGERELGRCLKAGYSRTGIERAYSGYFCRRIVMKGQRWVEEQK